MVKDETKRRIKGGKEGMLKVCRVSVGGGVGGGGKRARENVYIKVRGREKERDCGWVGGGG